MLDDDSDTAHWQALDRAHHIHPFSDPKLLARRGVTVIVRADGCYVWDSNGNKILDGMAGLWCVNVGYGRKALVEAAAEQMSKLPYYNTFFQSSTPVQIQLAHRLSGLTPDGIDHFYFASSGSEANDTAIRLVRHYWHVRGQPAKKIFIGRNLGYHGSTLAATSLGGMKPMHALGSSLLPGFEHIMEPHWYMHGGGLSREDFGRKAAQALEEKILALGAENVAAFIGEPVQGAGGVIEPPPSYWPEIERICRRHDVLLIVDEVICGFGRLGEWFGSQFYKVSPDLITMAKGLSSGYLPVAALGVHSRIFEVLNEGGNIPHGYTYSGHPVACAVALANLRIMEDENLVDRVRSDTGPYFRESLRQLAQDHPIVAELRGEGLIAGLHIAKNPASREFFTTEDDAANKCRDLCLEYGLIMRAVGQTMVVCPPLTISHAEIDEMIEKASIGLDRTAELFGVK